MRPLLDYLGRRLIFKINIPVAAVLIICISVWAYFHLGFQQKIVTENIIADAQRMSNTVRLGLHYAMMLNSRDDIKAIVQSYGKVREIRGIRIMNKQGEIMFASRQEDVGGRLDQSAPVCRACHANSPATLAPGLDQSIYSEA